MSISPRSLATGAWNSARRKASSARVTPSSVADGSDMITIPGVDRIAGATMEPERLQRVIPPSRPPRRRDGRFPRMTRVLLVEDHEEIRDFLSRRLKRRGYDVILATDGQQAVDKARAERPDIILLDMNLPI